MSSAENSGAGRDERSGERHSQATRDTGGSLLSAFRHHPSGVAIITADAGGPVSYGQFADLSQRLRHQVLPSFRCFIFERKGDRTARQDRRRASRSARSETARLCATSGVDRFGPPVCWDRLKPGELIILRSSSASVLRDRLAVPGMSVVCELLSAFHLPTNRERMTRWSMPTAPGMG